MNQHLIAFYIYLKQNMKAILWFGVTREHNNYKKRQSHFIIGNTRKRTNGTRCVYGKFERLSAQCGSDNARAHTRYFSHWLKQMSSYMNIFLLWFNLYLQLAKSCLQRYEALKLQVEGFLNNRRTDVSIYSLKVTIIRRTYLQITR